MLSSALVQRRGYEGGGYDTVGVEGRAQGTSRSGDRDKRGPTEGGRMALCAAMSHVLGSSLLPTLDVRRFGAYCVRVSDVAQDAWWQHTSHQLTTSHVVVDVLVQPSSRAKRPRKSERKCQTTAQVLANT